MTPGQQSAFAEQGILLLRGALARRQVEPIRTALLDELKRLRIWSSGKALSASFKGTPPFQQIAKLSGLLKQDSPHLQTLGAELLPAATTLAGARLLPAQTQFLVSLPHQGTWTLEGLSWHTDIAPAGHRRVPGVQAFLLVDDVQPRGGATLAVAGSHLVADREGASAKVREVLRRGEVEDGLRRHGFSIVEMSGHAGDVFLMDMRVLHTPSINATNRLRMMATVRYLP